MNSPNITIEELNQIQYKITPNRNTPSIEGLIVKDLVVNLDGRGDVIELWSKNWFSDGFVNTDHVYQSATDFGVVKSWHMHILHTDQITVTRGKLQLTIVDLRRDSSTFGNVDIIFLGSSKPRIVKIPPMLLHGWKALSSPEVIAVNMQSHVYDPADEIRYPWDCVLTNIWQPLNG
jgi:dTDP-4-dehydrorhamnose 3,5-epimerase